MGRRPRPTKSQVEMINQLNAALGTDYPVPDTRTEAAFLVDGLVDQERKQKRVRQKPAHASRSREVGCA